MRILPVETGNCSLCKKLINKRHMLIFLLLGLISTYASASHSTVRKLAAVSCVALHPQNKNLKKILRPLKVMIDFLQMYIDKIVPKKTYRWIFAGVCFLVYIIRILFIQTHHLITYCLSLYLLHGLITFLTPKNDEIPDIFDDVDVDFEFPANIDNEFRPFIRRLPEFQFWVMFLKLVGAAFVATFFDFLDIPAYVPILFVYFGLILVLTIRNMLRHMKKYKYNPFFESKKYFKTIE